MAARVADRLVLPLDVVIAGKVGVPYRPEMAMGAVAEPDVVVVDLELVTRLGLDRDELDLLIQAERRHLVTLAGLLRGDRPARPLHGRRVLVVDDGLATGLTAVAACRSARQRGAGIVVFATPVAAPGADERLGTSADEVVVVHTPGRFGAVSRWYRDFAAVSTEEAAGLIGRGGSGLDPVGSP